MRFKIKCPYCNEELNIEENIWGLWKIDGSKHVCPKCHARLYRHYSFTYFIYYTVLILAVLFGLYFISLFLELPFYLWLCISIIFALGGYLLLNRYFNRSFYDLGIIDFRYKDIEANCTKGGDKMPSFIYNIPTKVYFGKDQLAELPKELAVFGKRVLLCYGKGSIKRNGLYERITMLLANNGFEYRELSDIDPNPKVDSVREGALIAKEFKADVVLAVGGGSVIDCAKFVAAATYYKGDAWDLSLGKVKVEKALPIVTVLTLAATGSEMNATGVISNPATFEKLGAAYEVLYPRVSFLDPTLTYSVSPFQSACGSADIFFHVLEVYFNPSESMFLLDSFMEGIMKTVLKYAKIAFNKGDDYEARANLMWASSWAINGLIKEYQTHKWSAHSMEHPLSAYYDIAHGLGLAIIVPKWLRYALNDDNIDRYVKFGVNVFNIDPALDKKTIALKAIEFLEEFLYVDLKLPASLKECEIDDTYFVDMAYRACKGDKINGFITLNIDDVIEIYKMCL